MKQVNKKIGVLDLNTDNIYVLNSIREKFVNDDIYYINDLNIENIDEMDIDELKKSVSNSIEFLLSKNVDVILVASDSIIEFCEELFMELKIPVINVITETINFVNEQYEYKNIGFLSTNSMIEANIYQKNIRYNHLYTMVGDDLKKLILTHLVKTTESFQETKNVVVSIYKKDVDIIIPSLVNFLTVKTEIFEYIKDVQILPLDEILVNSIKNVLYKEEELPLKGKGITYLCSHEQFDLTSLKRLLKIKYQVVNLNQPQ